MTNCEEEWEKFERDQGIENRVGLRAPQPWVRELILQQYRSPAHILANAIAEVDPLDGVTVLFRARVISRYFSLLRNGASAEDTDDPLFKAMLQLRYLDKTPRQDYGADVRWSAFWEVLMTTSSDNFAGWFHSKFHMGGFGVPAFTKFGAWFYLDSSNQVVERFPDFASNLNKVSHAAAQPQQRPPREANGCFIATAIYGSYDCPEVWILRRFRDSTLASSTFGKLFIQVYYAISPPLLRILGSHAKPLFRGPVNALVRALERKGYSSDAYYD